MKGRQSWASGSLACAGAKVNTRLSRKCSLDGHRAEQGLNCNAFSFLLKLMKMSFLCHSCLISGNFKDDLKVDRKAQEAAHDRRRGPCRPRDAPAWGPPRMLCSEARHQEGNREPGPGGLDCRAEGGPQPQEPIFHPDLRPQQEDSDPPTWEAPWRWWCLDGQFSQRLPVRRCCARHGTFPTSEGAFWGGGLRT